MLVGCPVAPSRDRQPVEARDPLTWVAGARCYRGGDPSN